MEKLVRVKVKPGARREVVTEIKDDSFQISVKEQAEANAANDRVRRILALRYAVPIQAVRVKTGHTSFSKTISIRV